VQKEKKVSSISKYESKDPL